MRVLVTGASGFIGAHVVGALRSLMHEPVGFVRNARKFHEAMELHGLDDVPVIVGNVNDAASVQRALRDVDAVVHTVGIASIAVADADQMMHVNVGGTRNVLDAATELGLDPIVHVSSVAALFRTREDPAWGPTMTADEPLSTEDAPYTQSKAAAEHLARAAQDDGHPVVIFHPGGVAGPVDAGTSDMTAGCATMMEKGAFILPTGGGTLCVDVRDLAQAIARSIVPDLGPRRYMAGGHWVGWDEWVAAFEDASENHGPRREIRIMSMPRKAVLRVATGLEKLAERFDAFETPIGRESALFMGWARPTDDSQLTEDLGVHWRPVDETVDDMLAWMVETDRVTLPGGVSLKDASPLRPGERSERNVSRREIIAPAPRPDWVNQKLVPIVTSDTFRSIGPRVIPQAHAAFNKLSGGRFVPGAGLVLTTIGRKSGERRESPLETVARADGSWLVIGSNWAQDHHPGWTHNLIAQPDAEILVRGRTIAVTAHLLEGDEREAAWQEALKFWPAWQEYTTKTDRQFRIFNLTRR